MATKLLYLEDNGYLLKQTLEFLEEDGYEVTYFTRIDSIIEYFGNNHDRIDCIITDLHMDDVWLGEYRAESEQGLFSGWVWLKHFVFEKGFRIPCIIYSGYITELKDYLYRRGESDLLSVYPITCVSKGGNDNNGYPMLIQRLEGIIRN